MFEIWSLIFGIFTGMFQGFKKFILRGNVVDLAVGVVIGAAFNNIVSSFVKDLLTPFITLIGGNPDFSRLTFTIGKTAFKYGDFMDAIISFIINATIIYFFVVAPLNRLQAAMDKGKPAPEKQKCPFCFSDIPLKATRCLYCTSHLDSKK